MEGWYVTIALVIAAVFTITQLRKRPTERRLIRSGAPATRVPVRAPRRRSAPVSSDLAALAYWTGATVARLTTQVRLMRQAARDGWQQHAHRPTSRPLMSRVAEPRPEIAPEPAISAPETVLKQAETAETAETPPLLDDTARRQIELELLAKLLTAKVIGSQTRALEVSFDVKAGGGKEYQALRAQLQQALDDLAPPAVPPPVQEDTATRLAKSA